MSKYIIGILMGILLTLVVVSTIYPSIYTDMQTGNFWQDAANVINNWITTIREAGAQ